MIHKSGWHHVAIYALLIAVMMLGLAFYLNDPICRNSASCALMGVLGAAAAENLLIAGFAIFNARHRAKSICEWARWRGRFQQEKIALLFCHLKEMSSETW